MKKVFTLAMILLFISFSIFGCKWIAKAPVKKPQKAVQKPSEKVLKVWSFTNEAKTMTIAFKEKHPDVKIEYTMIPMTEGEYQLKLKSAMQSGNVPDVVALEASFVREFIESPYLADLSDLKSEAQKLSTYQFTIDVATDQNGVIKGYSFQATPGVMYYRRSLAKAYFGTDDPTFMQSKLSNMEKLKDAARIIKQKSNGNTYTIASIRDLGNPYFANRSKPWIVNNKLYIDPKIYELFDISKTFRQNGYEARTGQWNENWFSGMNDSLADAKGNVKKIFAYFLPTWGLSYVLQPNSKPAKKTNKTLGNNTFGDWAAIPGPMPYFWGGTWFAVPKDAANKAMGKEFVKFATLSYEHLKKWALGYYTNEYLRKIDPSVEKEISQPAGDFVSSKKVVDEITPKFENTQAAKFLGGQNPYVVFSQAAQKVNLAQGIKNLQGTDDVIQRVIWDPLEDYASGKISRDEAIKRFKEGVKNALPEVDVK